MSSLPLTATLGAARMLGRALVLPLEPTAELRDLHRQAWSALPDPWPPPEDWIPHISLALNVPTPARAAAVALFTTDAPIHGHFVSARSYNTETRTLTNLPNLPPA
ncbi:hypothetical protein ADL15_05580 [Actinoplanes awajinensis subsp. mycoplanecinus]|uniref:2'-5' RNA ligase n=1 Tax=Actinoplanes awajinensis subsp. mycoplanecinus TaxID=135947 RepID=A0A0X3VA08_9ACTN|nr:hypothetical protein ADL15_05580 [Actinoplanes awajinensis subsp. mycoplanecinus]